MKIQHTDTYLALPYSLLPNGLPAAKARFGSKTAWGVTATCPDGRRFRYKFPFASPKTAAALAKKVAKASQLPDPADWRPICSVENSPASYEDRIHPIAYEPPLTNPTKGVKPPQGCVWG
jgi:hypothetical protein